MRQHETFTLACTRLGETAKALHVEYNDGDGEIHDIWIPFSQIDEIHFATAGRCQGTVVMTKWIAEQKELI